MQAFEAVAAVYFGGLGFAGLFSRAGARRRAGVFAAAVVMTAAIAVVAWYGTETLRAWSPNLYLVAGYWLPGLLAGDVRHPTRFETWLQRTENFLRPRSRQPPRGIVHLIELAYLFCYPLVPLAFAVVWIAGGPADVRRFWLAVLPAGYVCYVSLPWLVSRPPRLVREHTARAIARLNVFVLGRVSHQLNTFPSGHVAVSLAAAAGVAQVSAVAGALVLLTALAIALGAVAGRYHYMVDVLLGVLVAGAAAALAFI